MNKSLFVALALSMLTLITPGISFALVDPATIHAQYAGGGCPPTYNGSARTAAGGGYFNTGGIVNADPSIFPPGFFDDPTRFCFEEKETWINLGPGSIGGDTVNVWGWFSYGVPYTNDPSVSHFFPVGGSTPSAPRNNIKENYSFTAGPTAAALSAALVANPTSIVSGEQSLLTWSSTGAVSCVGTNFNTQGATSGSIIVQPSSTTNYSVACSTPGSTITNPPSVINHSEADAYNSTGVIADMQTSGINLPAVQGNTAFGPDQTTMNRVCVLIDGAGSVASNIGARSYSSPGNNGVVTYNGSGWVRTGGVSLHMSTSFTCTKPGGTTTTPGNSATASATVSVTQPNTTAAFSVSCNANPQTIAVGRQVTWSSTVTGGPGTYVYSWSGTDGLSGSGDTVLKTYSASGHKTGKLSVTYTPSGSGTQSQTQSQAPASTAPTNPPVATTPPQFILPPAAICPAIAWATPVTGCAGSWQPVLNTNSCQTGWQCVPAATTGTGGAGGGTIISPTIQLAPSIINLINSFEPTPINKIQDIKTVDGFVLGATTAAGTSCSVQFSPSTITQGQSATLSWIATGASSLSMNNGIGSLTPATSGSKTVTPTASGTYIASGTTGDTTITNPPSVVNHSEADAYNSTGVIADMQTSGINLPAVQGNTAFGPDQTTMNRVCVLIDGTGSTASNIGARSYNSPGNNAVVTYNGSGWVRTGGVSLHMSTSFTCTKPGGTTIIPGSPFSCQTTLTVNGVPAPQSQTIVAECNGAVCTNATCSCTTPNCGGVEVTTTECSDGVDNTDPEDTKIDMTDPGCSSPQDDDERDSVSGECSDGIDNNSDGLVDTADPGCYGGGGGGGGGGGVYDPAGNEGGGANSCVAANFCKGSDVYARSVSCSETFVKSCPLGCVNGECVVSADPDLNFAATPPIVRKGQSCTINLSARNVTSCSLSGPGLSKGYTAQGGIVSATQVVTPALSQTSTYKLSCSGTNGKITSKTVDCKVAPTFEEF